MRQDRFFACNQHRELTRRRHGSLAPRSDAYVYLRRSTLYKLQNFGLRTLDQPVGPLGRRALIVVELHSKRVLALQSVPGERADAVEQVLEALIAKRGAPLVLKLDNGSAFIAKRTAIFCRPHGISLMHSPPRTPRFNGTVEVCGRWAKARVMRAAEARSAGGEQSQTDLDAAVNFVGELPRIDDDDRARFQDAVAEHLRVVAAERGLVLGPAFKDHLRRRGCHAWPCGVRSYSATSSPSKVVGISSQFRGRSRDNLAQGITMRFQRPTAVLALVLCGAGLVWLLVAFAGSPIKLAPAASSASSSGDGRVEPIETPFSGQSLQGDPQEQRIAIGSRRVEGRTVAASGVVPHAAVTLSSDGHAVVTVMSSAEGRFIADVPWSWPAIAAEARGAAGLYGAANSKAEATQLVIQLGDIVMRRHVSFDLQFEIRATERELLAQEGSGTVVASISRIPSSFLQANTEVAEFALSKEGVQRVATTVVLESASALSWKFVHSSGVRIEIQSNRIADEADTVALSCEIDARMLLLGQVDASGRDGLGGVPISVTIQEPSQQWWEIPTDTDGAFRALTPRNAYGNLGVRWGSIRTNWAAGEPVSLVESLGDRVVLRVVGADGQPIDRCSIALRNQALRNYRGELEFTHAYRVSRGAARITDWTELRKGMRLFIGVPGLGEFVHVVTRDVVGADAVYTVELGPMSCGEIKFSLDVGAHSPAGGVIGIHIAEPDVEAQRIEYRFAVNGTVLASGWRARGLLAGNYECVVERRGVEVLRRQVTVIPGKEVVVTIPD